MPASPQSDALGRRWRSWIQKFRDHPRDRQCAHLAGLGRRLIRKTFPVLLEGSRYCVEECLEPALCDVFLRTRNVSKHFSGRPAPSHRLPLGLLLLSRQQLKPEQLRAALDAQRTAGHGKIGEWLLSLGYVTQQQVTAGLARQWSCPVVQDGFSPSRARSVPSIPTALLEQCAMAPVGYAETNATLHMAFAESIDYGVLYAIERMTGCRTEPCMAMPSFVQACLSSSPAAPNSTEAVFDGPMEIAEPARIVLSYCSQLNGREIRINDCGPYTWVRLFRHSRPPMDLLFRLGEKVSAATEMAARHDLKSEWGLPIEAVAGQSIL